ncbi:hypothetical protein D9M71_700330 [compost metagenome]
MSGIVYQTPIPVLVRHWFPGQDVPSQLTIETGKSPGSSHRVQKLQDPWWLIEYNGVGQLGHQAAEVASPAARDSSYDQIR